MTNLFTNLLNLSDSSRAHRVHTLALTVGSPSAHRRGTMLRLCSVVAILLTMGVGNVWGTATSGTFYKITATGNLTTGYYIIAASNNANANSGYVAGSSINSNKRLEGVDINLGTSATTITNPDDALVFLITKTTVDKVDYYTFLNVKNNKYLYQSNTTRGQGMAWGDDATNFTLAGYNSSSPAGFKFTLNGASNNIFKYNASNQWFANYTGAYAVDMTPVRLYKAYKVTYNGNGNTGGSAPTDAVYYSGNGTTSVTTKTNTGSLVKTGYTFSGWNTQADGNGTDITAGNSFTITANTTLYAKWTAAASCSADPTIGTASLNGSFSLSSIPLQCSVTSDGGTGCTITDAGFVYVSGGGDPTISNNKTSGTYSTNITGSITGTFSKGTTYKIKAYATNGHGTALSSSSFTLIPRSVTFHKNDGSETTTVQYVNNGTATALTSNAWSRTGYTFSGWNTNADGKSGDDYADGANVTASGGDVDLYAKWTEKPKYTITLNAGNGTVSADGWTAGDSPTWSKKQANGDEAITFPEASCNCAGWNFVGWATSSASNVAVNPVSKTAGSTLTPASDVTYYAVYQQSTPGGTTYNKITSTGDLTTGNYVIKTSSYAMKNDRGYYSTGDYYYMKETSNSNSGASFSNSDATITWTIIKFGDSYAIKNGSNFVGIDADGEITFDTNCHLFSASYDGTNSRWVFTSKTYTSKQIIYNYYFRAGSSQSTAILLYKQGTTTGNYYTSPSCSDYTVTASADPVAGGTVYQSATSVASGGKIYVYYCATHKDYNFNGWTISGTGVSPTSASTQFVEITAGSANVTATANFVHKDWHVQWKVNGEELTGSDLGDAQNYYDDGEYAAVLPPNPSSCDTGDGASDVFVGWTTNTWGGKSTEPAVLFKNGVDAPYITADVTYHAVFAKESSSTYKRITSTKYIGLDSKMVIVNNASEKAIKNDFSAVDVSSNLSADDATLSSVSSDWVWTADDVDGGYYILKNGTKQLGVNKTGAITSGNYESLGNYSTIASSWTFWESSDDDSFTTTIDNCFYAWNWYESSPTEFFNFMDIYNATTWQSKYYTNINNTTDRDRCAIRLYIPEYTNYLISCCTAYEISLTDDGSKTEGDFAVDPSSACEGATVSLTATPSTGYTFTEWTVYKDDDDSDVTSDVIDDGDKDDAETEMTMPAYNVTVDATFTAKEYTIVLDKNGGTSDGVATATYNSSSLSSVTDASYTGHTLLGYYTENSGGDMVITANGALVASVSGYTDANAKWIYDDDAIFAAHWKPTGTWGVTITAPSNGTITVTYNSGASSMTSGSAYIGGSVTITATGNTGYELATNGLKVNGTTFTSGNSLTLSEDITISATFSLKKLNVAVTELSTVTISAGDIDEGDNDDVDYGSSLTLSYSAVTSGHYWSGWKVTNEGGDDVTDDVVSGSTLTVPDYDIIVTAKIYGDVKAWCIPTFNVTGDVHLTSTAGVYVNLSEAADNLINFSGSDLYSVSKITINYLDGNGDEVAAGSSPLRLYGSGGTSLAEGNIISFPGGAYNQDYSVRLTVPAETYNTEYNYKLLLKIYKGSRIIKMVEHPMNGRALPEEFVIAVKSGDQWYALPNNLASTSSQPSIVPLKISVDNSSAPTAATYAPTTAAYKATGRNAATKYMNGIRFTTTTPSTNWLQTAKADAAGNYNMWLSTTNSDSAQVWYLSSSDFGAYTLKMDAKHNGSKKMGIYTGGYMGFHSSPSASDIYFLPITNKYTEIAATVSEWGQNSVVLAANPGASANKAQAHIDDGSPTEKQDITAINGVIGTAKNVKVPLGDIDLDVSEGNEGKLLYIDWFNGSTLLGTSMVTIPRIVAEDRTANKTNDTDKKVWNTEVHVLPGATLTIDGNTFVTGVVNSTVSISELQVYPGATVNVSTGTLAASTLRLKNGWTRAGTKKYDVARVYIADDAALTKTKASMDYDIYESSEGRHFYPLAVPFATAIMSTDSIDYADSYLAKYSKYGMSGQYVIKEYNGARRANVGPDQQNNWTPIASDATLLPGKGYIMTAVPVKGEAIIRVPLTYNDTWTADGEKATVSDVTKNIISVTAHTGDATEGEKYANMGWNLLGVPFMSCYTTSASMYAAEGSAAVIQGKFDFETGEWDGEDVVRYVNVPTHDFSEYIQTDITDDDTKLLPGWCFFVQIETNGNLTFLTADQAASSSLPIYAPKHYNEENMPTVKTGIILSDGEKSDKATLLISDKYSATDYEINADLEKMFGNGYTLATYCISGETRLAYNALSNADASGIIPIGYRAPADGEYTFSINPRYAENDAFEHVNLIDYETGAVTDLLQYSYTFSTNRTQNDARFALNVTKRQDTTTDLDNGANGINDVNGVRKLIINDKVYIIRGGQIYDATGKRVWEIDK